MDDYTWLYTIIHVSHIINCCISYQVTSVTIYVKLIIETLYRVAQKTAYFSQYVDAITTISVWGNFS